MRCSSGMMVVAALTIGEAVAGPAHAHLHRKIHQKKQVDWKALDWNAMGIDWTSAYAAGQHSSTAAPVVAPTTAAPPAVSTTAPAAATTPAASPKQDSVVSDLIGLFNGVVGHSNSRTTFGGATGASGAAGDFHYGNVGSPYGSNIIKVSSAAGYQFTNTFVNTQSKSITINIWNKVGSDGQPLSGSALAPKDTSLTFTLAAGASQVVAFMAESQVGWAEACSATAISGAFATTWGEANFLTAGSGYDVSAIMNPHGSNYKMVITSAEAPGCTSSNTENYWLTDTQPIGQSDGSCYIAQSTATLKTIMGGTI